MKPRSPSDEHWPWRKTKIWSPLLASLDSTLRGITGSWQPDEIQTRDSGRGYFPPAIKLT